LGKIPGYTLLRGIVGDPENLSENAKLKVALANIDDAWLLSFIVEELPDGMLAVFVPSAPTPTAGNVYLMTEQQVKRLDVPVAAAAKMHHAAWRRCWPAAESNSHQARDSPRELVETSRYGTLSDCSFRRCLHHGPRPG